MASWELGVDIDPIDRDEIGEEDDKWNDNSMNKLERKFEELRRLNVTLETSYGKDIMLDKDELKNDTIELAANQIYDKQFNDTREKFK